MKNKIEIECPEGFEFDGVRCLNLGDYYLNINDFNTVHEWKISRLSIEKYIALKKIPPKRRVFEEISVEDIYKYKAYIGVGGSIIKAGTDIYARGIFYREVLDEC